MAFCYTNFSGKECWFKSTMSFPPLNSSNPLQSIPWEMPISICTGCLCSTRAHTNRHFEIWFFFAADKKQYFSFYRDLKLNWYSNLPDIYSLCFAEILSGTSALWILHVGIISVALSYSFPPPPWPNLEIYPLLSTFIFWATAVQQIICKYAWRWASGLQGLRFSYLCSALQPCTTIIAILNQLKHVYCSPCFGRAIFVTQSGMF